MKNSPQILVVDDDARLADNLVEYLTRLGYSARAVYNGKQGLAAFEQGDFKVVITDLMMPEMNGMAMLQAVRKLDPDALVIMLTGYGTVESAVKAIKSGAIYFDKSRISSVHSKLCIDIE
jgi:DNA-binding NtrC family response regulator